jgi:uncharacterized protein with ATP-grasp and redox domains
MCSSEFLEAFKGADLVISKGQGNFETLSEAGSATDAPIFFLLTVKCPVIGAHLADLVGRRRDELPGRGEMVLFAGFQAFVR